MFGNDISEADDISHASTGAFLEESNPDWFPAGPRRSFDWALDRHICSGR